MSFLPTNYVWVHTRVEQFHAKYPNGSIKTIFDVKDGTAIMQATVEFDWRTFNWTSFWELKKEKALEKLETVAVWRALAFAWFEIKSWIASKDEMDKFDVSQKAEEILWWTVKQSEAAKKAQDNFYWWPCEKCWKEKIKWAKGFYCKHCYIVYMEAQKKKKENAEYA